MDSATSLSIEIGLGSRCREDSRYTKGRIRVRSW